MRRSLRKFDLIVKFEADIITGQLKTDRVLIAAMSEWNGRALYSTSVAPNDLEHAVKYVTSPREHPVYYNYIVCLTFRDEMYRYRTVGVVT